MEMEIDKEMETETDMDMCTNVKHIDVNNLGGVVINGAGEGGVKDFRRKFIGRHSFK